MYNLIKVQRLVDHAIIPSKSTAGATGLDLASSEEVNIPAGGFLAVGTGLKFDMQLMPIGTDVQIRPRSGLAAKYGITVLNAPGTIDRDYVGEIKVILINHGPTDYLVRVGDRIAQLVLGTHLTSTAIFPVEEITSKTGRGDGGFGSTGK